MNTHPLLDANLILTTALPSAASESTAMPAMDLGDNGQNDQFSATRVFFRVSAPALSTSQLPDGTTLTMSVWSSPNADLSAAVAYLPQAVVLTGAGGEGAAAAFRDFALPTAIGRYLFAKATTGAGTGDCSAASGKLSAAFF